MITNGNVPEFRGLSTDDKSKLINIPNGTVFFEMDTKKVFMFDKDTNTWKEI